MDRPESDLVPTDAFDAGFDMCVDLSLSLVPIFSDDRADCVVGVSTD